MKLKLDDLITLGFDSEFKECSGSSSGTFAPDILGKSQYQANEVLCVRADKSIFVVARQDFSGSPGFQGKLGTAFYINGLDQASPYVVNAFIIKDNGLHIGRSITGEVALEGDVLNLSHFNFTARVGHDHQAMNVELKVTLPSS